VKFSISIVSHRNGEQVDRLLSDLRLCLPSISEIIVTINAPEDESFLDRYPDLPIVVLRNKTQKGFGANHNGAFRQSTGDLFAVVNPDVRLSQPPFAALESAMEGTRIGACAPVVYSPGGRIEDSVRRFPTFRRLAARVILKRRHPDYRHDSSCPQPIDWAAGMFIAFAREAFEAVRGFDTWYFMYFEDADICRRLWRSGWSVNLVPAATVIHDAQRASHHSRQHLKWHVRSAFRFLIGI